MAKKLVIVLSAFLLILLAASGCQTASPFPYFDSEDDIDVSHITFYVNAEGCDITAEVDMEALVSLLREIECSKGGKVHSYSLKDVHYEIDGICGTQPFHIVLGEGKLNLIYISTDKGVYRIADPAALENFLNNR